MPTEPSFGIAWDALTNLTRTQYAKTSEVKELIQTNQQMLKWMATDMSGGGDSWTEPVKYKGARGIGSTRAIAQQVARGNAGRIKAEKWVGEWATLKASLFVEEKALILANRGGEATEAFLRVQHDAIKQTIIEFGNRTEEMLSWSPGCALAYGSISAGVYTLANPILSASFKLGDVCEWSANDGSSSGHSAATAYGYVIAVGDKTVTFSASDGGAAGSPSGWSGSGYVFRRGQFGGGSDPIDPIISIPTYLPASDPGTTLLNVDRTKDVVAFSGVRIASGDLTTTNVKEILQALCTKYYYKGYSQSSKKAIFVHPEQWEKIRKILENEQHREVTGQDAETGLTKLDLFTPIGKIPVIPWRYCNFNQGYLLDHAAQRFRTCGKWPQESGTMMGERAHTSDSEDYYEWRWTGLGQLQMPAPGANGVAYLPGTPDYL